MEQRQPESKRIRIVMNCTEAELPPVRDALVLGKKSPVGSKAMLDAMQAMTPGVFALVPVDHPTVEAVLVRRSDLRKVPRDLLVKEILRQVADHMDETDAISVDLRVEIVIERTLELGD